MCTYMLSVTTHVCEAFMCGFATLVENHRLRLRAHAVCSSTGVRQTILYWHVLQGGLALAESTPFLQ